MSLEALAALGVSWGRGLANAKSPTKFSSFGVGALPLPGQFSSWGRRDSISIGREPDNTANCHNTQLAKVHSPPRHHHPPTLCSSLPPLSFFFPFHIPLSKTCSLCLLGPCTTPPLLPPPPDFSRNLRSLLSQRKTAFPSNPFTALPTMDIDKKYDNYDFPVTAAERQDGHAGHLNEQQIAQVHQLRMMLEAEGYTDRLDTLTLVGKPPKF